MPTQKNNWQRDIAFNITGVGIRKYETNLQRIQGITPWILLKVNINFVNYAINEA